MILDVGCGNKKRGDIGIDYSRNSQADVIADAHYLPFKDCVFDKVISVTVLEHSPNPLNFLKEQYRILEKEGKIELITDNAQYYLWSVLKFRGGRHEIWHRDHYMIFFPKNVMRLMKLAGFQTSSFQCIKLVRKKWLDRLIDFSAKLLIKFGLWRRDCLYRRFKIKGEK